MKFSPYLTINIWFIFTKYYDSPLSLPQCTKTLHVKLLSLGPNIIDRPVSIVSEFISLSKKSARRQPNYRSTKPQWTEIVSEESILFSCTCVFSRLRRITTFVLCSQSPPHLYRFCLTRGFPENNRLQRHLADRNAI